jgi:hypothetical protein
MCSMQRAVRQVLAISSVVFLGARIVLLASLIMTLDQLSAAAENANFAGLGGSVSFAGDQQNRRRPCPAAFEIPGVRLNN